MSYHLKLVINIFPFFTVNILSRINYYYHLLTICTILTISLLTLWFVVLLHKTVSQNELESCEIDRALNLLTKFSWIIHLHWSEGIFSVATHFWMKISQNLENVTFSETFLTQFKFCRVRKIIKGLELVYSLQHWVKNMLEITAALSTLISQYITHCWPVTATAKID